MKTTIFLTLLTVFAHIQAVDQVRKYDFLFHDDRHKLIVRLDSNSEFFKKPYLHRKKEFTHKIKGKEEHIKTETSILFSRYLKETEVPQKCKYLFHQKVTDKKKRVIKFEANLVQYDSLSDKCAPFKFSKKGLVYYKPEKGEVYLEFFKMHHGHLLVQKIYLHREKSKTIESELKNIEFHIDDKGGIDQRYFTFHFYVNQLDYEFHIQEKSDYDIKISDLTKHHVVELDKNNYNVNHPIIKEYYPEAKITYSVSFNRFLQPDEMPLDGSCDQHLHVEANYMVQSPTFCSYGQFRKMSGVWFHKSALKEDTNVDYDYVGLVAMPIPGDNHFIIELVGREVLGYKNHKFTRNHLKHHKNGHEIYDILRIRFEPSEYKITVNGVHIRFFQGLILLIIPTFFLIMFNKDYKKNGIYFFQFGIIFNFFSQVILSVIEKYDYENDPLIAYSLIAFCVAISFIFSRRKLIWLVIIWKILTVADYVLMAFLMRKQGTLYFAIINVVIFKVLSFGLKKCKPETRYMELSLSLTTSLCLLNLLGNILYFTTPFNRLTFFMKGMRLHERKPALYYLGFGVIFSLLSFARLFLTDYSSWNREARMKLPSSDPSDFDSGDADDEPKEVELSETLDSDKGKDDILMVEDQSWY